MASFKRFLARRARPRPAGDRRAGDEPHVGSAPVVPARPPRAGRAAATATSTCGATPPTSTPTRGSSSPTPRRRTGRGTRSPRLLLAPLLLAPARPQLRQPRRAHASCSASSTSWFKMGVDGVRLDAIPYLFEREGTNCENLPETHDFLQAAARPHRRALPGPHVARRGQPVAGGRRRVLRRRRRVPHGVPLPGDAAPVPGRADGDRARRSSTSSSRRRRCPTAASGRCSCATTTS